MVISNVMCHTILIKFLINLLDPELSLNVFSNTFCNCCNEIIVCNNTSIIYQQIFCFINIVVQFFAKHDLNKVINLIKI